MDRGSISIFLLPFIQLSLPVLLRKPVADHLLQPLHEAIPVLQADDAVDCTEGTVQAAPHGGEEGHVVRMGVRGQSGRHGGDAGGHDQTVAPSAAH